MWCDWPQGWKICIIQIWRNGQFLDCILFSFGSTPEYCSEQDQAALSLSVIFFLCWIGTELDTWWALMYLWTLLIGIACVRYTARCLLNSTFLPWYTLLLVVISLFRIFQIFGKWFCMNCWNGYCLLLHSLSWKHLILQRYSWIIKYLQLKKTNHVYVLANSFSFQLFTEIYSSIFFMFIVITEGWRSMTNMSLLV